MARKSQSWLATGWQAAAVFILLSASGECLQCYWCGPRAEQVHRQERAPPCGAGDQTTACEPGYTHCAVVATSPPFAESRHCVKFYQDECYAQYCNSTRSFRMTCPCRGDLCNGPNTEREIQAFAALTEIVANARIKRNAITYSSFISAGKAEMNLIENDDQQENSHASNANDTNDSAQTEPPVTPSGLVENSNISSVGIEGEANATPEPQTDIVKAESTTEAVKEPVAGNANETNDTAQTEPPAAPSGPVENSNISSVGIEGEANAIPEPQTDIVKAESTTEAVKEPVAMEVASTAESLKLESTTVKMLETSIKPVETMKAEVNEFVNNQIKPSMQLPTAEALQQNASPIVTTEKTIEQTSGPTTLMTTVEHENASPMPTEHKNESAVAPFSTFIFISSLAFKAFL